MRAVHRAAPFAELVMDFEEDRTSGGADRDAETQGQGVDEDAETY